MYALIRNIFVFLQCESGDGTAVGAEHGCDTAALTATA